MRYTKNNIMGIKFKSSWSTSEKVFLITKIENYRVHYHVILPEIEKNKLESNIDIILQLLNKLGDNSHWIVLNKPIFNSSYQRLKYLFI